MRATLNEGRSVKLVSLPKSIAFDGTGNWQAFIAKFKLYASESGWDSKQSRNYLSWALDGDASIYMATLLEREPGTTYEVLVGKLEKRFTSRELPEVSQMQFSYARQIPEEDIVEWAARLSTLASQAFPDLPEHYIQRQVVMRFCQGSADKEAGQHALNSRPRTVEEAVDLVKWFQHSHKAIYLKPRKEVRQVSQSIEVSTVQKPILPPTPPAQGGLEKRVASLEGKMDSVIQLVESLKTSLAVIGPLQTTLQSLVESVRKSQASPARFRGRASPAQGNFSPGRNMACYQCGNLGHFKLECPERSPGLKVSFVSEDPGNDSGSTEEVQPRS